MPKARNGWADTIAHYRFARLGPGKHTPLTLPNAQWQSACLPWPLLGTDRRSFGFFAFFAANCFAIGLFLPLAGRSKAPPFAAGHRFRTAQGRNRTRGLSVRICVYLWLNWETYGLPDRLSGADQRQRRLQVVATRQVPG
jgi:hypothetical protein